jgi:hypothetical protein
MQQVELRFLSSLVVRAVSAAAVCIALELRSLVVRAVFNAPVFIALELCSLVVRAVCCYIAVYLRSSAVYSLSNCLRCQCCGVYAACPVPVYRNPRYISVFAHP